MTHTAFPPETLDLDPDVVVAAATTAMGKSKKSSVVSEFK
jgi:hypothetical protein